MIESIDQIGCLVKLQDFPKRIVSLVPSQSELLYDLDLKKELIGITKFCIRPAEMFHNVQRVGGTKNIDLKIIDSLNPDLIIGNKEENTQKDIRQLSEKYNVWMSDINTIPDALHMIEEMGRITNRQNQAKKILDEIRFPEKKTNKKIIYLIWNNPMMCAGKNTFIDAMIEVSGLENSITETRYPEITIEKIKELQPDYLFLSTEPFPFKENHCNELQDKIPGTKVMLVDGEMFSWYGSRLRLSAKYFETLIKELK